MLRLLTMGGLSLADERGAEVRRVLRRPKRVAFVCLLATAPGWVSRERLMALLWPELDESHARHALRQTLCEVKAALPRGAVETEAGAGVRLPADQVWCDAARLREAADAGRHAEVRDLYRGEFLSGFDGGSHSREFEDWLDRNRRELRGFAIRSTWALAAEAEAQGRTVEACQLAAATSRLQPYDEAVLRRSLLLLGRLGDRSRACVLFRDFERRIEADLEISPSAESRELIERLRSGMIPARHGRPIEV